MDRLPRLGAIVIVKIDRELPPGHRYSKWRVVSFPGVDTHNQFNRRANAHTVNLELLGRPDIMKRVSGFWCEEVP